jgi:hypothetical protein
MKMTDSKKFALMHRSIETRFPTPNWKIKKEMSGLPIREKRGSHHVTITDGMRKDAEKKAEQENLIED